MNWMQMKANIMAWEDKIVKVCPVKIMLTVFMVVILWQLTSIKKELGLTKRKLRSLDVSWEISDIQSTVDDIKRNMN